MDDLIETARDAYRRASVPYSDFPVGAALETTDGSVFIGCNIEVANFSNTLHAEEVAIGQAIAAGHEDFARLAVSSAARDGLTPCGMCRQTLAEFCTDDFPVICDEGTDVIEYTLGELLPASMGPETLARD